MMKKLIFVLIAMLSMLSAKAQFGSDATVWSEPTNDSEYNHSGLFLNTAVGYYLGQDSDDFGFSVDLGYRWKVNNHFAWEIAKIAIADDFSLGDNFTFRALTGIRFVSNGGFYANAGMGYAQGSDVGGAAVELGFGKYFSRLLSLGIVGHYNFVDDGYDYSNTGFVGLQLGINF